MKSFYIKNKYGALHANKVREENWKVREAVIDTSKNRHYPKDKYVPKPIINTRKSIGAEPDSDLSDMSESNHNKESEEHTGKANKYTNEDTDNPYSDTSSAHSDKVKNGVRHSHLSEDEQEESPRSVESESEESEGEVIKESSSDSESESSEELEEHKIIKKPQIFPIHKVPENEKRVDFFHSAEQDEISGGCLPSFRYNHGVSSGCHEITEIHDQDQVSKIHSSKKENLVGLPRRSTVMFEGKVWTIEEDEYLRIAAEKNKKEERVLNWGKIAKEVNVFRRNINYERTTKECQSRYHEISRVQPQREWTDKEIMKCIELYKKYGKNWKLIAKKIPGKTDKQWMYKINSMQQNNQFKKTNFTNIIDIDKSKNSEYYAKGIFEPVKAEPTEREIERLPSGEQYKHIIHSQSGSSNMSESSDTKHKKSKRNKAGLDVIEEEISKFDDLSINEVDYFRA